MLLKYLLDNGADPLVTTDDDVSAGWISISKGYVEMLVILLSYFPKGHDVSSPSHYPTSPSTSTASAAAAEE